MSVLAFGERPPRWRRGDVYGQAYGGSTMADLAPGLVRGVHFGAGPLREAQPHLPVTPNPSAGISVGQFTLAEATIGLVALIALIAYLDKRVL